MGLDIRLPLGLLFALLGVILTVYGLAGNPARYAQSLGVNINLYWGMVLFVFGVVMLFLGRRGRRAERTDENLGRTEKPQA
jgi:membrane protein implicated in regulation of membrane protease activity